MKKLSLSLFLAVLLLLNATSVFASSQSVDDGLPMTIIINGSLAPTEYKPIVMENRALVPIRALTSLGLTFEYNKSTKQVTIHNPQTNDVLVLYIDTTTASKNGIAIKLDVPVHIVNGLTMVPIRFISDQFLLKTDYQPERNLLFLETADYKPQPLSAATLAEQRRHVILLPWTYKTFKPLPEAQIPPRYGYAYDFKAGDASSYFFRGGNSISFIQIHDGIAEVIWQAVDSPVGNSWSKEAGVHQELDASMFAFLRDRNGLISYGTIFGDSSLRKTLKSDLYTDIIQPIASETN